MNVANGFFLTIEGIEGVGKSTAIEFIKGYLHQANQPTLFTREPGGTPMAENLRKILLSFHTNETITADTELLLMFAGRAQHIANVIEPALREGRWVVSDRFVDATFAYQGGGRQINFELIQFLEKWIVNTIQPNATILLDAPPEIGLNRAKNKGAHDRIEQEKIEFFERVRAVYLDRANRFPDRFHVIDATQPLEAVQITLAHLLEQWLVKSAEVNST